MFLWAFARIAYKVYKSELVKPKRAFALYLAFLGDFVLGIEFVALPIKGYLLGANPLEIGLLGGLSSALYSFMPLMAGRIGDRIGSKVPITLFLITYPGITAVYFVSRSLNLLMIARVVEGMEWPFYWPSLESTAAISGGRKGLRNYNLSWGIGALAGPFAGGALVYAIGPSETFAAITLIVIVSAILSIFLFKGEKEVKVLEKDGKGTVNAMYFLAAFGYGFAGTGFLSYFPVTAYRLGISSLYVGSYEALMGFFRVAAMVGTGEALDRIGNKIVRNLSLSLLAAFIAPLGLMLGSWFWGVSPSLLGLFLGMAYAMSIHGVLEGEGSRGTKAGIFESTIGAGSFLGPVFLGFSASYFIHYVYSPYIMLTISGVLIAAATVAASRAKLSLRNTRSEQ